MDTLALLGQGLLTAAQPIYLLYALIGVTLGTAVGVLPGLSLIHIWRCRRRG